MVGIATNIISLRLLVVFTIFFMSILLVSRASALVFGSGTYGQCTYDSCSITISSSGLVNLDVIPSISGSCSVHEDTVTVTTVNSSGYTLSLIGTSSNMALQSGANSINASGATIASPAALGLNSWGYRVDGAAAFGAGPTSDQTNASPTTQTFAGVPTNSGIADILATTSTAAGSGVTTAVWYGVCADTSEPSGTYTNQVTYTAVTN